MRGTARLILAVLLVCLAASQASAEYFYWTETSQYFNISRYDNVGDTSVVFQSREHLTGNGEPDPPIGLALDKDNELLYWTQPDRIRYASTAGTGDPLDNPVTDLLQHDGWFFQEIVYDDVAELIYYTAKDNTNARRLGSIQTDGTNEQTLVGPGSIWQPLGLDLGFGKIYFTSTSNIYKSLSVYDLSAPLGTFPTNAYEGMLYPAGVVVDNTNGWVYWAENGSDAVPDQGKILGAPVDGNGDIDPSLITTILDSIPAPYTEFRPHGLSLNEETGQLFFTLTENPNAIARVQVDGTGFEVLKEGAIIGAFPAFIEYDSRASTDPPPPPPPDPNGVPEPTSMVLALLAGLGAVALLRRRRAA